MNPEIEVRDADAFFYKTELACLRRASLIHHFLTEWE